MTPLTHAAVATAICQQTRKLTWGPGKWILALALAFVSHYLLDSIPHFEGIVHFQTSHNIPLMVGLGALGTMLALLLVRLNLEAGRIWLVLTLWIALGFYAFSWWRVATAALALGYIAWKSPCRHAAYYAAAGMLAIAPDLLPSSFRTLATIHGTMHYRVDWENLVYVSFWNPPVPHSWGARLHDPYFLLVYGLEIFVEGLIFLGALYLFSREEFSPEKSNQREITESLEFSQQT